MSAYIVTQTGVVIEYARANCIVWIDEPNNYASLYLRKDEKGKGVGFIAKVPRGCVVSFDRPGVVQQAPNAMQTSLSDSLELIATCVETIQVNHANRHRLQKLKATLSRFDARSGCWKKVKP